MAAPTTHQLSPRRVLLLVGAVLAAVLVVLTATHHRASTPTPALRTPTASRAQVTPLHLVSGWAYSAPESGAAYWIYMKDGAQITVTFSPWTVREVAQGTSGWTAQEQSPSGYLCGHAPVEEVEKCAIGLPDGSLIITGVSDGISRDTIRQFTEGYLKNLS